MSRSVMRWVALGAVLLAGVAQAEPPPRPSSPPSPWEDEAFVRKAHLLELLDLAEAMGLSDAEALKLRTTLSPYHARRRALYREVRANVEVLHRAAAGDAAAFGQVDAAIQRLTQLRAQLQKVEQELYTALSQQLTPQRRARLALVLARMPWTLREMAHSRQAGEHGPGHGPPPGGEGEREE